MIRGLSLAALACTLVAGAAACKSSLPSDIDTICHAEGRSKVKTDDVREREQRLSAWINEHLKTERGRQLYSKLYAISPTQRVKKLRAEAQRAGLSACPLADAWAKDVTPPNEPAKTAP